MEDPCKHEETKIVYESEEVICDNCDGYGCGLCDWEGKVQRRVPVTVCKDCGEKV
jgi:hypothetical protein